MSNKNINSESESSYESNSDSNLSNLIDNYYNEHKHIMSKYISENDNYNLEFTVNDDNKFIVDVYNKKKHILKSHYEILGCYNVVSSIWTFSYATNVEKNLTKLSRKIKKYHKILKNSTENVDLYLFYTGNSSIFMSYKNLQDMLKFSLYVSEGTWIMSHKRETDNIVEFIIITDVIQYIK